MLWVLFQKKEKLLWLNKEHFKNLAFLFMMNHWLKSSAPYGEMIPKNII